MGSFTFSTRIPSYLPSDGSPLHNADWPVIGFSLPDASSRRELVYTNCLVNFYQLAASSHGSPTGNRRSGKGSVFSLFNLREKSRFWSDAVIRSGTHPF